MKVIVEFLKTKPAKLGITFSIFFPFIFLLIWMTGYNGATERIDQLHVGLVVENTEESRDVLEFLTTEAPFQTILASSKEEALVDMDSGNTDMVIVIPANLQTTLVDGAKSLTYYLNDRNSEIVKSIMEGFSKKLTDQLNIAFVPGAKQLPIQSEIINVNKISNFAISMLPMILGFIPFIALMTMNIQFNIASMIVKRQFGKWELFFGRQLVLASIAIIVPLLLSAAIKMFLPVAASFWQLWSFEVLVFIASICFTQLAFELLGNYGPLLNAFSVPFQLMTAGNIIAVSMLTPFYRDLGSFLPAPNGIQGAMHLVYGGGDVMSYAVNLIMISIVTWGLTVLRIAWPSKATIIQKNLGQRAA
ncbi:YhgE/Pip domain-containing protein [Paenibacillus sp. YN15]|uniref:YhgE/Pip domain-containing protein n=1 Tax=Paenibacillus sp. YN15 TaxID=1742774 RepID=UPI000DCDDCBE|nr:ABC transporter permease [Paenibacillus sp. YN15]RAV02684.1 ABC transporter permease [Paenibacillus sp. YN15]